VIAASVPGVTAITAEVTPDGVTTIRLAGRGSRAVAVLNRGLASIDTPEVISLPRKIGGQPFTDWLMLPVGSGGVGLPLVIIPYPGATYGSSPPGDFAVSDYEPVLNPQLLAANGYAVLEPSMPIGSGEPIDDIMAAIAPAIAAAVRTGRIDPGRVAVMGHSHGGYTALMMATKLPCLRSVIASASISDLLMMYGSFDPRVKGDFLEGLPTTYPFAWAENGQGRMGVPPWQAAELYLRSSPFYGLANVRAPVLLLHGDLDPLSVGQAERTYAALYRLGKDARLVRYAGEGHVPVSPANIRDRWSESFAWLRRTMAPRPPTADGIFDSAGRCSSSRP
jgi:dipeptidyl aminopeptidase/acylaminoacyl peptidase